MNVAGFIIDLNASPALLGAGDGGFGGVQLLMLAGGILGLGVVMRSTFRRVGRSRRQPQTSARTRYAGLAKETNARRDLEQIMVELDQLARQIHGRIDTRFAKLESVIRDADQRIDHLSRLLSKATGRSTLDTIVGEEACPECPDSGPPPSMAESADTNDAGGRHASIYRLADTGLSASQIAEKIGQTIGEVELILALRRTKRDAPTPTT